MSDPSPRDGAPGGAVVFVYFRASPAARTAVEQALRALQADLTQRTGDRVELALRDEPQAPWHTWLEHHRLAEGTDPAAYLARLAQAARQHGLDALADGGRHVEVFRPLDPRCA